MIDTITIIYIIIAIVGVMVLESLIGLIALLMITSRIGKVKKLLEKNLQEEEEPKVTLEEIKKYDELKKKIEGK
jgi:hypothetical protein